MSVKLVVSGSSKQSRIVLVGKTGKELLASRTFTEPRAKGATLRALKKLLGSDVIVEDSTTTTRRTVKSVAAVTAIAAPTAEVAAKPTAKRTAAKRTAAAGVRPRRQTTTVSSARKSPSRAAKSSPSA